jgi:hypothetical protein
MASDEKVLDTSDLAFDESLSLFDVPATNVGVSQVNYITHKPVNQFSADGGQVKFRISGAGSSYIDLRELYLKTLVRIVRADGSTIPNQPPGVSRNRRSATARAPGTQGTQGTPGSKDGTESTTGETSPAAGDSDTPVRSASETANAYTGNEGLWSIGPCQNLAQSLWESCSISMNDTNLTGGQTGYAYLSLLNLYLGETAMNDAELECQLFEKDTARYMNDFSITSGGNTGFIRRAKQLEGSKTKELLARLDVDVLKVKRYLLNNVTLDITLTPTSHAFRLLTCNSGTRDYILQIVDISLIVKQILPSNQILVAHQNVMKEQLSRANYYYVQERLNRFALAADTSSYYVEDAFQGRIPSTITLAFVAAEALAGNISKNPFNFASYDLDYVCVSLSGMPAPRGPLKFDFKSGRYLESYGDLYRGKQYISEKQRVTLNEYSEGFTLVHIDLSPQNTEKYYPIHRDGNVRLELRWAKSLPESVIMLARATYPGSYQCDYTRNIYIT